MIHDKRALRARLRAARDGFVAAGRPALPVPDAFRSRLRSGTTVASYHPIGSEADPAPLETAARAAGCAIALPHVVDKAAPIRFLLWEKEEPLAAGPFALRQPHAHCREVTPDIILTPLLGFDRALHRLGQGAGHYDRAFARRPDAWRLGIAWSVQEVAAVPTDIWDMPLHAVLTEQGLITQKETP